jgi:hypothetical protein
MLHPLLEVKPVLDEVMEVLDDRTRKTDRALEKASLTLASLENHQHLLPDELSRRLLTLLSHLHGNTRRRHSEICVAEIKRFYGALLGAIQQPAHHKTDLHGQRV